MNTRDDSTLGSLAGRKGPHANAPDAPRCTARTRAGERCGNFPMRGTTVCRMHGGSAPAVRAAAARRLATAEVEAELENLIAFESFQGITDPLQVMAELAERALATERALAARVNFLAQDDRLRYKASGAGTEQLRAEVALWERWHKQAAHLADRLAAHNFEERRVRVSEEQGQQVAIVLRVILERMLAGVIAADGLSVDAQDAIRGRWGELVPVVVPQELRRLTSGEVRS